MKFNVVFINTIKYILRICENTGIITAYTIKSAYNAIKPTAIVLWGFIEKHIILNIISGAKTINDYAKAFAGNIKDCYQNAKEHAMKHGNISGFCNFVSQIKQSIIKNKQSVIKVLNYCAPVVAVVVMLFVINSFSNITLALEVNCSGESLGYITDENVYNKATEIVSEKIEGSAAEIATEPQYNIKLVNANQLSDANELSNAIIKSSSDVVEGYGIYIDGEFYAAAQTEDLLNNALEQIKQEARASVSAKSAEFYKEPEIMKGLYLSEQIYSVNEIKEILNSEVLPIKTIVEKTTQKVIKYNTVTAKDNTKYEGYKKIGVAGENGLEETKVVTEYLNGVKQSEKSAITTVKEAVDEQITIGTREVSNLKINVDAKLAWPVERSARSYISCYYGGYYGHTGIDIAAPKGTQIYAATSGTVTKITQSDSSYGNSFYIDNGNGVITHYAHCSSIDVELGQTITIGDAIAKVGSTGNSTGPHLHFEVIVNGIRVNPAPYLGV